MTARRDIRIAYLSGAPRVSTREGVGSPGPRSHVLGFWGAAPALGWQIDPYVVGDRLDPSHINGVVARSVGASWGRRVVGDVARVTLSAWHGRQAVAALGARVDVAYERVGVFQSLGRPFRRRGLPWVVETNGLHWLEADRDRRSLALGDLARHLENQVYREADLVVAISPALADAVAESARIPRSRILVVPNGVDTTVFRPGPSAPDPTGPLRIAFVGTVLPWHGLDLLVEAAARVAARGAGAIDLRLIGDGPAADDVVALAQARGVRCQRIGRVPQTEVPRHLAEAEVGYCGHRAFATGTMYASPLKLYEYGSCGLPVLASDHEDARALAAGGDIGELFPSGSVEGVERALERLLERRASLRSRGAALAADIHRRHSWVARLTEFDQRLRHLLEAAR